MGGKKPILGVLELNSWLLPVPGWLQKMSRGSADVLQDSFNTGSRHVADKSGVWFSHHGGWWGSGVWADPFSSALLYEIPEKVDSWTDASSLESGELGRRTSRLIRVFGAEKLCFSGTESSRHTKFEEPRLDILKHKSKKNWNGGGAAENLRTPKQHRIKLYILRQN